MRCTGLLASLAALAASGCGAAVRLWPEKSAVRSLRFGYFAGDPSEKPGPRFVEVEGTPSPSAVLTIELEFDEESGKGKAHF